MLNHYKNGRKGRNTFFFCDLNEILIFMSPFSIEAYPQFFGLFWDKQFCRSQTQKKCAYIIADSKPCNQYGEFGSRVGRWSKGKCGLMIFHKLFIPRYLYPGSLHKKNLVQKSVSECRKVQRRAVHVNKIHYVECNRKSYIVLMLSAVYLFTS